jgi:hypothetical protein
MIPMMPPPAALPVGMGNPPPLPERPSPGNEIGELLPLRSRMRLERLDRIFVMARVLPGFRVAESTGLRAPLDACEVSSCRA